MKSKKKCVLIILDGLGIGELPDAEKYGDQGTNTLKNISRAKNLAVSNLLSLGLGNISEMENVLYNDDIIGCYGRMCELSAGKDSTTGHWEIAGLITDNPFPLFPNGFNSKIIERFLNLTGLNGILGNKAASGTQIIEELGHEHIKTHYPIVYTSADSVFQVAAHEEVIPIKKLYEICKIAREKILTDDFAVARVIARPFIGKPGSFIRTANRKDFSLKPPGKTMLNYLQESEVNTIGIGKIDDLFAGFGLNEKVHTKSNIEGINEILKFNKERAEGFIFINLVDFDMLYGHRNDALGYAEALEYFDEKLKLLIDDLQDDDLLLLTSDLKILIACSTVIATGFIVFGFASFVFEIVSFL